MHPDAKIKLTAKQLNESSDTPLYQQVYDLIREKIISGAVGLNSRLPAEQDIAADLGVSREELCSLVFTVIGHADDFAPWWAEQA